MDRRYREYLDRMLETRYCVLVYCRPPIEVIKDFSTHKPKSYDEQTKLAWLQNNLEKIVKNYDTWMRGFPHKVYDYTNPDRKVTELAHDAILSYKAWQRWISQTTRG